MARVRDHGTKSRKHCQDRCSGSTIIKHYLWDGSGVLLSAETATGISAVHKGVCSQLQRNNFHRHTSEYNTKLICDAAQGWPAGYQTEAWFKIPAKHILKHFHAYLLFLYRCPISVCVAYIIQIQYEYIIIYVHLSILALIYNSKKIVRMPFFLEDLLRELWLLTVMECLFPWLAMVHCAISQQRPHYS